MSEMWKEFKFSIDFREGDSKPLPKENGDSTADSNALLADEEEGEREGGRGSGGQIFF